MPDNFIIDSDICDGYPSFGKPFIDIDISSINNNYIMKNYNNILDSYPSFGKTFTNQGKNKKSFMSNYDNVFDKYPSYGISIDEDVIKEPYPKMIISANSKYKQGYPSYRMSERMYGAFADTPLLTEVSIPKSVKRIADWTFYNSAIKEVTISKDCIYGEHTFPEGCIIKFY